MYTQSSTIVESVFDSSSKFKVGESNASCEKTRHPVIEVLTSPHLCRPLINAFPILERMLVLHIWYLDPRIFIPWSGKKDTMPRHSVVKLDSAITECLEADGAVVDIKSSSGRRISTKKDGQDWQYYLKTSTNGDTSNTFEGRHSIDLVRSSKN